MLQEVGILLGLLSIFGLEMVDVRVPVGHPSLRRTVVHLGKGKGLI